MNIALCVLYFGVLALLSAYGFHRLFLVILCGINRPFLERTIASAPYIDTRDEAELPYVTIQLPLFNESTVVGRLLTAVAKMDYPASRLEIQVLDDSIDETQALARSHVERLRAHGIDI
ncbi:MAG: glycosyltransferase, partial [Myxococcales bacterium]|nr:glycosyltransferase [Myxococcales bacterium]